MRDDSTGFSRAGGGFVPPEGFRLINLTPHPIVLEALTDERGRVHRLILPPAENPPRLVIAARDEESLLVHGGEEDSKGIAVPVVSGTRALGIEPPLPEPQAGVLYVTSRALAEEVPERADLVWPEKQVRDDDGRVIAAQGLGRLARPHRSEGGPW